MSVPLAAIASTKSVSSFHASVNGDPSANRTVYGAVIVLVVIGILLAGLAIWLYRSTRVDLSLLAPLETMSDRKWRKLDPASQRRLLDEERPDGARPLHVAPTVPSLDDEFEAGEHPITGFDDLADDPDAGRATFGTGDQPDDTHPLVADDVDLPARSELADDPDAGRATFGTGDQPDDTHPLVADDVDLPAGSELADEEFDFGVDDGPASKQTADSEGPTEAPAAPLDDDSVAGEHGDPGDDGGPATANPRQDTATPNDSESLSESVSSAGSEPSVEAASAVEFVSSVESGSLADSDAMAESSSSVESEPSAKAESMVESSSSVESTSSVEFVSSVESGSPADSDAMAESSSSVESEPSPERDARRSQRPTTKAESWADRPGRNGGGGEQSDFGVEPTTTGASGPER